MNIVKKNPLAEAFSDQDAKRDFCAEATAALAKAFPGVTPKTTQLRVDPLLERPDSVLAIIELRFVCDVSASGIVVPRLISPRNTGRPS